MKLGFQSKLQKGFSLLEVMIAMMIFAVFITAYVGSEGYNKLDSSRMRNELILHQIAENILNQIVINPPEFAESLTLKPETSSLKDVGLDNYTYTVAYTRLEIPKFSDLSAGDGESEDDSSNDDSGNSVQAQIIKKMREYIKERIWQIRVTVENTDTGEKYDLTSWLSNDGAKLDLKF